MTTTDETGCYNTCVLQNDLVKGQNQIACIPGQQITALLHKGMGLTRKQTLSDVTMEFFANFTQYIA